VYVLIYPICHCGQEYLLSSQRSWEEQVCEYVLIDGYRDFKYARCGLSLVRFRGDGDGGNENIEKQMLVLMAA
jgi:hypothetical protein